MLSLFFFYITFIGTIRFYSVFFSSIYNLHLTVRSCLEEKNKKNKYNEEKKLKFSIRLLQTIASCFLFSLFKFLLYTVMKLLVIDKRD